MCIPVRGSVWLDCSLWIRLLFQFGSTGWQPQGLKALENLDSFLMPSYRIQNKFLFLNKMLINTISSFIFLHLSRFAWAPTLETTYFQGLGRVKLSRLSDTLISSTYHCHHHHHPASSWKLYFHRFRRCACLNDTGGLPSIHLLSH